MDTRQQLEQVEWRWHHGRMRFRRFWQMVIYGTTAMSFVGLWQQHPERLQGWSLVLVVGLVGTYLLAFELVPMNPRFRSATQRFFVAYVIVQIVIFALLTFSVHAFAGLGFALIGQVVSLLPPRLWAYPILIIILLFGRFFGLFNGANWVGWSNIVVIIIIFTGLFMSSEFMVRQRAQLKLLLDQVQQAHAAAEALALQNAELAASRQQTIAELEVARHELATAEREAGMLAERQRLARDIHDTLTQNFTSIVMHLAAAEPDLATIPMHANQHIDQARQSARDGLSEARRLVWALRPEVLDQASLPEALQRLAQSWSSASGVAATLTITGLPRPLATHVEVMLLRVAQEALANVHKHAHAEHVSLTLSFMEDTLLLDVQDDGVGFVQEILPAAHREGGYGLTSMRERVQQLGGTLTVESALGEGTTVVVEISEDH